MYSWGVGATLSDFLGEYLGLGCVSTMLCRPAAFACRGSSFSSPGAGLLLLLNAAAMLSGRMYWGQTHSTRAWATAAGIPMTVIALAHLKSNQWGREGEPGPLSGVHSEAGLGYKAFDSLSIGQDARKRALFLYLCLTVTAALSKLLDLHGSCFSPNWLISRALPSLKILRLSMCCWLHLSTNLP